MPNLDYEFGSNGVTLSASDDANINFITGSPAYVTDSGVGGSLAFQTAPTANEFVNVAFTAAGRQFARFYIKSVYTSGTKQNVIVAQALSTSGNEAIAQVRLNSDNTLSLRDKFVVVATTTTALTDNTWYRVEWDVNRAAGTQELRLYDGPHSTTALEIEAPGANSCNGSTATTFDRFYFGTVGTSTDARAYIRYDDTGWDATTWLGPTGSAGAASATYDLTITHTTDSADVADRTYEVDATGSVGAVSLTQTSGTTVSITESPTGVFTFADPGGSDDIVLDLEADDSGDLDNLAITITRAAGNIRYGERVFQGGDASVTTNWV